jgi:hypothetical protein
MTDLRELHFRGGLVSDAGLDSLKGMTELRALFLDLGSTDVARAATGSGLVHLRDLPHLETLNLSGGHLCASRLACAGSGSPPQSSLMAAWSRWVD